MNMASKLFNIFKIGKSGSSIIHNNSRKGILFNTFKCLSSVKEHVQESNGNNPSELGKIVDFEEIVSDKPKSNLNYKKIDGKSSVLTKFLTNVKSRKKREKSQTILLEGKRLIQDALDAGQKPLAVFFSRVTDVMSFKLPSDVPLYNVSYKDLQFWSDVSTTQGVLAIFPTPDTTAHLGTDSLGLTIVCDNVRDPGNMGTILRTAAAVGTSKIILTTGCVDLWEPKILRSACGAHFRLKIHSCVSFESLPQLLPPDCAIYLGDSDVPATAGEEPLIDRYEISETGEKVPVSEEPTKRLTAYQKRHLEKKTPLVAYTAPDYAAPKNIVLVVGGETEGLSQIMLNLAEEHQGTRIYIPLENGMESLNSATALGILAYEIRKHRLLL